MVSEQRNPFDEDPAPTFVEVCSVDFDMAWDGEGDEKVICPGDGDGDGAGAGDGSKGHFAQRGSADGRNWVEFAPCGHVVVLAEWDVF
jgi:hypothetical protein